MNIKSICIIGGDSRQRTLHKLLNQSDFDVMNYSGRSLDKEFKQDVIIFPMPVCKDEKVLGTEMSIGEALEKIEEKSIVLGGKLPAYMKDNLKQRNIRYFDYAEREPLALKNAVATAEGAIMIAIGESDLTIYKSKSIVCGYGRIGKIVARMLKALGSDVTVAARRKESRVLAEVDGFEAIEIQDIKDCDFLFNTVPVQIINEQILKRINNEVLIIDLASVPGGVDFKACKELGIKAVWALSLPGKISPVSAGRIIYEEIMDIFEEIEQ